MLLKFVFLLLVADLGINSKEAKEGIRSGGKKEVKRLVKEQNHVLMNILSELRQENLRQNKQERVLDAILTCFSCSHHARCEKSVGRMKCTCEPEFIGDGTRCVRDEFSPAGFQSGLAPFRTSWFFVSSFKASWVDARAACRRFGADLASCDDVAEWRHLYDTLAAEGVATTFYWLGARNREGGRGGTKTWSWIDGTKIFRSHPSWRDGKPEFYGNNCLLMQDVKAFGFNDSWRDYRCTAKFRFVCELHLPPANLLN